MSTIAAANSLIEIDAKLNGLLARSRNRLHRAENHSENSLHGSSSFARRTVKR